MGDERELSPEYAVAFEIDGSFRDIFVENTDLDVCRKLERYLKQRYDTTLTWSAEKAAANPLPTGIAEALKRSDEGAATLHIHVDDLLIIWYFYDDLEIEMTVDPREVHSDDGAERVLNLMREIGDLVARDVLLTAENLHDRPIYRYSHEERGLSYMLASGA